MDGIPNPQDQTNPQTSIDNPLKDTFKKENIKSLLKTESSKRIIRGGIATIIAILFFFLVMNAMLPNKKRFPESTINNPQTQDLNEPLPTNTSGNVKTQVGNPNSPTALPTQSTSKITPQPTSNDPVQKSQIYTIGQDFSSVTFTASYEDPNLLVDFVVIDPDGNTYTIGDEEKYEGRLTTDWKSTSRTIKITGEIKKGTWTAELAASKNVLIEIKLTGTPK